jgi:1-acyl-sn-glycerol-3-phosphate acyltransferase
MDTPLQHFPHYPSIIAAGLSVLTARLSGRKKSLRTDALKLTGRISPPVKVEGIENIPATGGFLIAINHYSRAGYNTAWNALSIAAAIPQEITYIMSEAWAFEGNLFGFILRPFMRFMLASINRVYGFLSMPSMVEGFSTPLSRAAAVRRVIEFVRTHPNAVIGLAPEGQDSPLRGVGLAPNGGGKFMLHLNRMGLPILPAAVAESSGQLILKFGPVFNIPSSLSMPPSQVDEYVRIHVRDRIGELYSAIE